jgi:hypothetical protein
MATVRYESRENARHKFWVGRYGRYAIRIDANRPGVYRWLVTLDGSEVAKVSLPTAPRPRTRSARPWTSCPDKRQRASRR